MALQDLLTISDQKSHEKIGLSEERIEKIIPVARQYIAFWREYPDIFVDFMQTGGRSDVKLTFKLYSYQRVFMRIAMRYKYVYAVFPRAYSKSFLAVLIMMVRAILYPGAHLFSTAGGKEQATQILVEKIGDICNKIPAFKREINWTRGVTREGKDACKYVFKNGSIIENLAARETSRGRRFTAGIIEECVGVDQKMLQEVVIPTMNVSRRCASGEVIEEESINQAQLYITTAGYKNTYSYNKLIQLLVRMVVEPEKAFIIGGSWRIPVLLGLQPRNFIEDLKRDSTFNEASFGREYESAWSGTVEDAFYNGEHFDRCRKLLQPEYEHSGRSAAQSYYVISCDVGRRGCDSIACVFKVTPQGIQPAIKSLVNIYVVPPDTHFEDQAIYFKRLFYKYKARCLVIDANGVGLGLVDYMVKPQIDPETGETFPDFGVCGGTQENAVDEYKKFKTAQTEEGAMYLMKANAPVNSECYTNAQVQLSTGKVRLLIDDMAAKEKLLAQVKGQKMTPDERKSYLLPFVLTSRLKDEMMNLREENEGINIILKRANKNESKDKFSAFIYGLYYIKLEEEKRKKKKKFNASEWKFFN